MTCFARGNGHISCVKLLLNASRFFLVVAMTGCGDDTSGTFDANRGNADSGSDTRPDPDTGLHSSDEPDASLDAGSGVDAGTSTILGTCAVPKTVTGEFGVVTVLGNTEGGPVVPLDLGDCGVYGGSLHSRPREVIVYEVPGEGPAKIELSLVNDGTPSDFDTVIQVRTACDEIPFDNFFTPSCFDNDVLNREVRSRGSVSVMGNTELIIIVTGFSHGLSEAQSGTSEGPYELYITATPTEAPTLVSATTSIDTAGVFTAELVGMNPEDEITGFKACFLDDDERPVGDFNDDGELNELDCVVLTFDNQDEIATMPSFVGTFEADSTYLFSQRVVASGAVKVRYRLINSGFTLSEPVTVEIELPGAFGQPCSSATPCYDTLVCTSEGTCGAPADLAAVCESATDVVLEAPVGAVASRSAQTGIIPVGEGTTTGKCVFAAGKEQVFNVTVPDGTVPEDGFDLVVNTDLDETNGDTIVHIRGTCGDTSSELACNDDFSASSRARAVIEKVTAGTYTVFVEQFDIRRDEDFPFGVEFLLRPLVESGDSCDPVELDNRCVAGSCDQSTLTCP